MRPRMLGRVTYVSNDNTVEYEKMDPRDGGNAITNWGRNSKSRKLW